MTARNVITNKKKKIKMRFLHTDFVTRMQGGRAANASPKTHES